MEKKAHECMIGRWEFLSYRISCRLHSANGNGRHIGFICSDKLV